MPLIMIKNVSDYRISLNIIYASFFMGFSMLLIMSYNDIRYLTASLIGLVLSVFAIRNQWFIGDKQFLQDMIPHHSMALLTSSHILGKTRDPRIRELAENIFKLQQQEIVYMKSMI
jgi:hypothetical protein